MSNPKTLENPVEQRLHRLVRAWKAAVSSSVSSSMSELVSLPSYREIVAMGEPAMPYLLAELEREPDWWFAALKEISGADPVPAHNRGKLSAMTQDWLKWGRAQGYRW